MLPVPFRQCVGGPEPLSAPASRGCRDAGEGAPGRVRDLPVRRRGVAAAGYLQFRKLVDPPAAAGRERRRRSRSTIPEEEVPPRRAGRSAHAARARLRPARQARRRTRSSAAEPHSDTIVLVRLDPKRDRVAVLSLPRDLAVTIPGYADGVKINQAYDEGGAGADAQDGQAPLRERDRRAVRDQRRHRRQLQRLPARGQLRARRLRRRRPRVLQPAELRVRGDRHRGRLPAARRLGRARLRALPPYRLRPLPRRAPAGLPAPGGRQPRGRRSSSSLGDAQELRAASSASTSASTRTSCARKNLAGMLKTAVVLAANHAPVNQITLTGSPSPRTRRSTRGCSSPTRTSRRPTTRS